jgi:HKD family nuclease
MFKENFYVQADDTPGRIHAGIIDTAASVEFAQFTSAVAYVTSGGCESLDDSLDERLGTTWRRAKKQWLVSLDFGITEPDALEYLAALPNSKVFVANASTVLARKLRPVRPFHPKVFLFEEGGDSRSRSIFCGSANLTVGGLFTNTEVGSATVAVAPIRRAEKHYFDELERCAEEVRALFDCGSPLNDALVKRYRRMRPKKPRRIAEDDDDAAREFARRTAPASAVIPPPRARALAAARNFWVEVQYVVPNLGPGLEGNQIDLQRGSRVFFGFSAANVPKNSPIGTVQIHGRHGAVARNIRFGNNMMDKLDLPMPGTDGPPSYANTTLLFTRRSDDTYDMRVGTSAEITRWKRYSRAKRTLYRMQSGREFGVF